MKKIIHVNKSIIQYNAKHQTNLPVCRVQVGRDTKYGKTVDILGPSKMVYDNENPLKCGAKLWIETDADVVIEDECVYSDIQHMKEDLR